VVSRAREEVKTAINHAAGVWSSLHLRLAELVELQPLSNHRPPADQAGLAATAPLECKLICQPPTSFYSAQIAQFDWWVGPISGFSKGDCIILRFVFLLPISMLISWRIQITMRFRSDFFTQSDFDYMDMHF